MTRIINKIKNIPKPLTATIIYMFVVFFQSGVNLITTPLFSRILSTTEYGITTTYNSWFSILSIFITLNLSSGVYNNALLDFEKERDKMTFSFFSIGIFNSIIFWLLYFIFKNYINAFLELPSILIYFMIFNCLLTSAWSFFLAREKFDYKYINPLIITLITFIFNPVFGYFAIKLFPNYKPVAKIIGCAIPSIIFYLFLMFKIVIDGKSLNNKKYWKYALSFNLPLIPHYLSGILLASSDRIMIQKLLSFETAGIYGVAYQLSLVIQGIFTGINSALIPYTYKHLKENDYESVSKYALVMLKFVVFSSILIVLCGPEIIKVLASKEYYSAVYVIPPVVLGLFLSFVASLFGNIEFYYKKTKFVTFATFTSAIVNILLNFIFIPKYGFVAAGYTTLLGYVLIFVLHFLYLLFMKKLFIYNINSIMSITFLCSLLILLSSLIYSKFIIRLLILIIIFLLIVIKRKSVLNMLKDIKGE